MARAAWAHAANAILGAVLLAGPPTFGYGGPAAWSDAAAGALLVVLGALGARGSRAAPWGAAAVGLWLLLAPLVLPGVTAVVFAVDTVVGAAVVALALAVPRRGAPGEPDRPPGWSYNPSTWRERAPPVLLAVVGFLLARYLAAFQLGFTPAAWDPLFGGGTERVLTSDVSRAFPVSDAGLGAVGYLLDALAGAIGDERRWRTMPWIVLLFGVLIVPFGVVSITLVVLQPVAVGAWCTLCLATAVVSLLMIPFAVDEVVLSLQYLAAVRRAGGSWWAALWRGGERPRTMGAPPAHGAGGGLGFPPALVASAALGLGIMAAPAVLEATGAAAAAAWILGPLVVTFAVIASAEPARSARLVNVVLGLAVAAAPFVVSGADEAATWALVAAGVLVAGLSIPRGRIRGRYGGWERSVV